MAAAESRPPHHQVLGGRHSQEQAGVRLHSDSESEADVDSESAPDLVDALVPALSDSNPKFVQGSLSLLIALTKDLD